MQRFDEKAFGRLGIPGGTEEKFQRIAFRVDGPVEVHPGFPDFDVRLVDFPRVVACFQMRPRTFVEFRGKVLGAASLHPQHLKAMIAIGTDVDLYEEVAYNGGIFNEQFWSIWKTAGLISRDRR